MSVEVFPVQSPRRKRAQLAQHALGALLLVSYAADRFSRPHAGLPLLAVAEIVAALAIVAAIAHERLRKAHGGIAWVELAGAAMALVEAMERTEGRHHVLFIILSYFPPLILALFALFDAQIAAAHYLKVDEEWFEMRLRLLFLRRIRWDAIRTFRVDGTAIECQLAAGGSKRFNMRSLTNRDAALAWTAEQFRRHGVAESVQ